MTDSIYTAAAFEGILDKDAHRITLLKRHIDMEQFALTTGIVQRNPKVAQAKREMIKRYECELAYIEQRRIHGKTSAEQLVDDLTTAAMEN